ncbi:hypothetical protein PLICRDRAFT_115758 [Plicaturopsis crispa FD-325 SS-3]|nr:hypothetical protein PLICRDRAFT_115758 [Plicaturopsis crispa FD-325 SS-3]
MAPIPAPEKIIPSVTLHPRTFHDLLPLLAPPVGLADYPALPSPPRPPLFTASYTLSTHILPAAFPRAPSAQWTPPSGGKADKAAALEACAYMSERKERAERDEDVGPARNEVLWTVCNRYARRRRTSTGLTLVLVHGVGTHKETWEPTLQSLLARASGDIEEVWALDCVQHGDSALVNDANLGDIFDLGDYSRDVTNFLLYHLPEKSTADAPVNLPRLPERTAAQRRLAGFTQRKVIGVAHSIGSVSFVYSAHAFPKLFDSLVLIDPMIMPEYVRYLDAHRKFEAMCLRRQWLWETREQAERAVATGGYYQAWSNSGRAVFNKFALIDTPEGQTKLKAHPWHEVTMLLERRAVYETWELLAHIPPTVPIHWIWGATSTRSGGSVAQAQTSWRRGAVDSNDALPGVGHMVPQEAPEGLGERLL